MRFSNVHEQTRAKHLLTKPDEYRAGKNTRVRKNYSCFHRNQLTVEQGPQTFLPLLQMLFVPPLFENTCPRGDHFFYKRKHLFLQWKPRCRYLQMDYFFWMATSRLPPIHLER